MKTAFFLLAVLCGVRSASAQFVSIGGGAVFPQDRQGTAAGATIVTANWGRSGIVTLDAGMGFLPLLAGSLHYSYARPDLFRSGSFGTALSRVGTHTLTLDARLRSPEIGGLRVFGFAGVGFSRANAGLATAVSLSTRDTFPVFTFGGGVEKRIAPLLHVKGELRDYLSGIPESLFSPGGSWHRVAATGGITLGR